MSEGTREPLLDPPPGESGEAGITVPGLSAQWWRKSRLLIYTVLLLISSLGNAVYFKRMTNAMPNYSWYLSQLSSFVYIPFFLFIAGPATVKVGKGLIPSFVIMGIFDGLAGTLTVLGGVHTSGTNQVMLQQAVIPITMCLSVVWIGKRFHWLQYSGAGIIVLGIALAKLLAPTGDGGTADVLVFNFLFVLALVPNAASSVFKEVAFRGFDGDLDVNVLQFWVAVFQVFTNFVAMPIYTMDVLGPQRVQIQDMPDLTIGGSRCLFFLEDQIVCDCDLPGLKPCDHCGEAWGPVLGYLLFNLAYNICTMQVIKHGSAALSFLVATLRMPLSAVAFSSPLVMGSEARAPTFADFGSLVVIICGLSLYRCGGQSLKNEARREAEAQRASGTSPGGFQSPASPAGPQFASPQSPLWNAGRSSSKAGAAARRRFVPLFSTTGLPGVQPAFACVPVTPIAEPRSADRVRSDLYRRLGTASPPHSPQMSFSQPGNRRCSPSLGPRGSPSPDFTMSGLDLEEKAPVTASIFLPSPNRR